MAKPEPKKDTRSQKNYNCVYYQVLRDAERELIRNALAAYDGDIAKASEFLGISYSTVYRRAKTLGGVLPNEARREPFTPLEHLDEDDAKHHDSDHSVENGGDVQGDTADSDA